MTQKKISNQLISMVLFCLLTIFNNQQIKSAAAEQIQQVEEDVKYAQKVLRFGGSNYYLVDARNKILSSIDYIKVHAPKFLLDAKRISNQTINQLDSAIMDSNHGHFSHDDHVAHLKGELSILGIMGVNLKKKLDKIKAIINTNPIAAQLSHSRLELISYESEMFAIQKALESIEAQAIPAISQELAVAKVRFNTLETQLGLLEADFAIKQSQLDHAQ